MTAPPLALRHGEPPRVPGGVATPLPLAPPPSGDTVRPGSAPPRPRVDARAPEAAEPASATADPPRPGKTAAHGAMAMVEAGQGAARWGGLLQVVASLLWLPQAAAIAFAVAGMASGAPLRDAAMAAGVVLGLGILRALLDGAGARLLFRAARGSLSRLRARVAMDLSTRSPLDRERPASGLAASAMAEQAEAVVPYLTRFCPARLKMGFVPLAILAAVLPFSWVAALVLVIAAPLIPLFMALVGWRAKAASEAQMVELGSMNAFLLDRLRGLATIRALDGVDITARRLAANAQTLREKTMAVLRIAFLSSAVLELFSALGVAMVAVYVGFHLLGPLGFGAWGWKLTLGEGLFILLLAPAFFEPLREFAAAWHDRASGEAAFAALDGLSGKGLPLPGAGDETTRPARADQPPAVEVKDLAFRHAGADAPVLAGFHLCVAPGERVAVSGPSGAGKSTLLSLLAGLAPADAGEIRIAGTPLSQETAASLRTRMAFIGQAPHFFAGSLFANITLGRPGLGGEAVTDAIRLAALSRVAREHAGRSLGEGGTGLSGGEARRLALARAAVDIHCDLILADEPTAHLDAETAAEVTQGLLELAKGRTLIVATHDPVLVARMDREVALGPPGALEEEGPALPTGGEALGHGALDEATRTRAPGARMTGEGALPATDRAALRIAGPTAAVPASATRDGAAPRAAHARSADADDATPARPPLPPTPWDAAIEGGRAAPPPAGHGEVAPTAALRLTARPTAEDPPRATGRAAREDTSALPTSRHALLAILALFLAERRGMLLAGLSLAMATLLSGVLLVGLSGWFITAAAIAGLSAATALTFDVFAPAAGIRFLALARTAARYGERLVTHDVALSILARLRERLFRGWAEPGAARALLARPAKLLFRLTLDIDALDSLYLRVFVPFAAALAAILALAFSLGAMDLRLGAALGGALALAGLGLPALAARAALKPARRRAFFLEALRARGIDLVAGQTDLAMAGRLPAQRDALSAADGALARADDQLNRIETLTGAGLGVLGAGLLSGALLGTAMLVADGAISTPVAALGILLALGALEPFASLKRGALELGRTLLAARRIAPRLRPEAPSTRPAAPPPGFAARLDGVTARHGGAGEASLREIHLAVEAGERIAIIGASGAGKSTLLGLLAGEMTPEAGTVEALSATLLTQRTELFQDTLRENLRLADPEADDARLWRALQAAGLADHALALPSGLATPLGEGGLGLSGGQGRRLALARLVLKDTPLWLLDEPTDGLDAATARDVVARLLTAAEGRTLLIATHTRREAEIADRLVILNQGRMVGTPRRGEEGFAAALAALRPD